MCNVVSVLKEFIAFSFCDMTLCNFVSVSKEFSVIILKSCESNSNPTHTIQCCNCLLCVTGKVMGTVLIPHAYLLCSFCLSNLDINSYLQTWSTFLTSHTALNTAHFCVLCWGYGRHSYICVHIEVQPHRFVNSYLLEHCGNLQHWKLSWTLQGVPDTSMSDVCPKHLVSAVFPWSLAIFCYFSLNSPYYLHNNNNNSKLNQPSIEKETTYTVLGSDIFPEIEGFMLAIQGKAIPTCNYQNTLSW